jgi:tRNA(His) 5'-end guanylyltransferase
MKRDEFGDRMKGYEDAFVSKVDGSRPVYMRLDGRSFSKFTRGLVGRAQLVKPRDSGFEQVFVNSTIDTVEEFHFALGFHQSDEVSLFFHPMKNDVSQLPFDGKVMKLCSVVSSYFTARFVSNFYERFGFIPEVSFDARVCEMPDEDEATNMLVWRYKDAERNLIQDHAHHEFGAKALHGVSTREKYEMIGSPEIRPGNFIKRVDILREDGIVRHRVEKLNVDFKSMSFGDRRELIYGKVTNV